MDIKEQFFKHFCDLTDTLMLVLDNRGNIVHTNQFTSQLLKTALEDLIGLNWFDNFIPINNREAMQEAFLNLIESNIEFAEYFENEVLDAHNNHFYIRWHNKTLFDDQNKVQFILAAGIDISDLKEAQDQLKQIQLTLEALQP